MVGLIRRDLKCVRLDIYAQESRDDAVAKHHRSIRRIEEKQSHIRATRLCDDDFVMDPPDSRPRAATSGHVVMASDAPRRFVGVRGFAERLKQEPC
jgi:hypothetical protein